MKKNAFWWQPELSTAIIYWSCTFAILFVSLILALEYTRPYLISNIVLVFFFLFAYLGLRRRFEIRSEQLIIKTMNPFSDQVILLSAIQKITVGEKSLEIYSNDFAQASKLFLMGKKSKQAFLETLKKQTALQGPIVEDSAMGMNKKIK
ncbi:EbsA family protein [Enterococcus faecalis]